MRFLIFLIFYFSLSSTYASSGITLLLMFEEPKLLGQNQILGPEYYEQQVDLIKKTGVKEFVFIYFSVDDMKRFSNESFKKALINAGITNEVEIKTLIISTHGMTDQRTNKTLLNEIGGFGEAGSFGKFRTILSVLKNKFSQNFHLSLMACSTFCGLNENLEKRIKGLSNELMGEGSKVTELSIWGGTVDLPADYLGTQESMDSIEEKAKNKILTAKTLKFLFIPLTVLYFGSLDYFILQDQLPAYLRTSLATLSGGVSLLMTGFLHHISKSKVETEGLLTRISSTGTISYEKSNYLTIESLFGSTPSCESLLSQE